MTIARFGSSVDAYFLTLCPFLPHASPDPLQVRRQIICFQKPLVFRGLIDTWPMLKFTASDWNNLFGENLLECRVGKKGAKSDELQWERQSCIYDEFIKWSENCGGGNNSEFSGLETSKHFLYYGYNYIKDTFDPEVLQCCSLQIGKHFVFLKSQNHFFFTKVFMPFTNMCFNNLLTKQ
jgi:hypothetical protein